MVGTVWQSIGRARPVSLCKSLALILQRCRGNELDELRGILKDHWGFLEILRDS